MPTPVLLLPGMLCDAASWGSIPDDLTDVAEPRVVDFGLADTIDAMAETVLAAAPERFAVAGHSMGGRVALAVQQYAPNRVIALGLLGTSCEGHADAAAWESEVSTRRRQIEIAERMGLRGFAETSWLDRMIHPDRRGDPALVGAFLDMMDRQNLDRMRAHIHAGLTRRDMTHCLPSIACPTLVLAGDSDAGRPPPVHQAMAARMPSAVLALIPRSGHMVMMERPSDVAAVMRRWLAHTAHVGG